MVDVEREVPHLGREGFDPPWQALVMPFRQSAGARPGGFLVAGLNSGRPLDEDYRAFASLAAGHIAAAIADATAFAAERRRARALAELDRAKSAFFANVSHELRTPLASLIGFVETLRGPAADDPPAQQRFLEIMAEQGARMNRLIDDLLSLSRIELTEHQAPSEPLDLNGLVQRMAAGFEPRLVERRVDLAMRIEPDLPMVAGDADQMAQVLQNLLDNGLKYGRDGGVLALDVVLAQPGTRWPSRRGIVLSVADQGAGIPREHLPRLTERFYRVDKGRSRAVGGTGLGLAIVKHIVNRHRGQLLIESEEGKGTTVSVWLPVAQA
jgi:two-component system phosphate regulon sensor histidine kinase PhoR